MKVKSNKAKQTITLTGDASEMALLLQLAAEQAEAKYNETIGIERQTYSDALEEIDTVKNSITNGNYFA